MYLFWIAFRPRAACFRTGTAGDAKDPYAETVSSLGYIVDTQDFVIRKQHQTDDILLATVSN
jgi:hypothetical protein